MKKLKHLEQQIALVIKLLFLEQIRCKSNVPKQLLDDVAFLLRNEDIFFKVKESGIIWYQVVESKLCQGTLIFREFKVRDLDIGGSRLRQKKKDRLSRSPALLVSKA